MMNTKSSASRFSKRLKMNTFKNSKESDLSS